MVTGATSPLGHAIAPRMTTDGAALAVTGHTPAKLRAIARTLEAASARHMWCLRAVRSVRAGSPLPIDGIPLL